MATTIPDLEGGKQNNAAQKSETQKNSEKRVKKRSNQARKAGEAVSRVS